MQTRPPSHSVTTWTGLVTGALGVALVIGGLWLAVLGGSLYYLLGGAMLIATARALLRRQSLSRRLYALFLVLTTLWALAEVRFDWWPLVPRLSLWFVLGLWLATPKIGQLLNDDHTRSRQATTGPRRHRTISASLSLWLALAFTTIIGLAGLLQSEKDLAGTLPMDAVVSLADGQGPDRSGDWNSWGSTAFGDRYSPLTQITPKNVGDLKVAWSINTGDNRGPDDPTETTDENTPLNVGNTLYVCTPHSRVLALDATTGATKWTFDPKIQSPDGFKHFEHMTCRGVAYHDAERYPPPTDRVGKQPTVCLQRIFLPTADARLIALDADNGKPCDDFGDHGTVTLRSNIGAFKPGGYYSTSPPAVTRDLVIVGGHVSDNVSNNEPSGVIRAYNVRDGRLVWNWDAGNPDATKPIAKGETYTRNSPNMWSVASVDERLGLIYLPMGNQTPDQWGGQRTASSERFGAGVTALEIATGKVRWTQQFTHHDLWDMDVGGQPTLIDLQTKAGMKQALIASTKQGSLYVLDRRTGEPIVPITEVAVPQGAVAGDHTAPTQPMSARYFSPSPLTEASMWGGTAIDQMICRIRFKSMRYDGMYTPPSEKGSIVYPGNFGVFDWGGVAVDPVRQLLVANPGYMAFLSKLVPKGSKPDAKEATSETDGIKHVDGIPFDIELEPFLSPLGIPCQAPPWGYVTGVDLRTNTVAWQHRNGTIRDSSPIPLPIPLGVPSLGGMITTAGGVAFLSGTLDQYLRAYDLATGTTLWKARLPAGGQATPMTYSNPAGKQFVVVTAGGHGSLGTKPGDAVIAYSLP
ncbi:MAG: glucose dehydrogenase [Rhizobacter sp.]|nr:glucose dehydrogenase [Rhizobacter sp.]